MKKILLALIFVIPTILEAQKSVIQRIVLSPKQSFYATQLNGSTQLWADASPSNLDLNGAERLANTGFETDVTNWTVRFGTIERSTVIKKTGTASGLLVANGAGAAISSETITDATTNKGTAEVWVYCGSAASTKSIKLWVMKSDSTMIDSTTTTVTAVTWTKLVNNKRWDGTQTGLKVRVGFNGGASGDSIYIDDVSLTQAYDALWLGIVNITSTTTDQRICSYRDASAYGWEIQAGVTDDRYEAAVLAGSTNIVSVPATGIMANTNQSLAVTFDRTGNLVIYVNGTVAGSASMTEAGKIVGTSSSITIGRYAPSAIQFFGGKLGQQMFVRFNSLSSDIATTIARINSTWKRQGFPKAYTGGTIVLDIDWKYGGTDQSASANHLTGTASPLIVRSR